MNFPTTNPNTFRDLHQPGKPFILANAWDAGSAKVLAAQGATAIGTSSAAHAFTLGRPDMGHVTRDEALAHAADLIAAVKCPVSGDFENGFGPSTQDVSDTVRLAGEIGLAGCSIEDTALPDDRPYDFTDAVKRIEVAVKAARDVPGDFVLCARADGIMNGHYDHQEAIRRLKAFEAAGADCLYAPLPENWDALRRIMDAVDTPVNVLLAGQYANYSYDDYTAIGVARLSFGSALARVTHKALIDTAFDALSHGDFSGFTNSAKGDDVDNLLKGC